uniref:Uncharacterized protein n=1 Tax=Arundo donax TaxID=35708 RepID=A0A0A9C976_ARUDO
MRLGLSPFSYAAGVQRRLQKLVMRSMHWKTVAPSVPLDLVVQFLHAGWHPRGAVSPHRHCGGNDLVHAPQLSQHGHGVLLAAFAFPWLSAMGRAARTARTATATNSTWGFIFGSLGKYRWTGKSLGCEVLATRL